MGVFGLGAPEVAVCIAVAALILGPDKLAGEPISYRGRVVLQSYHKIGASRLPQKPWNHRGCLVRRTVLVYLLVRLKMGRRWLLR